MARGVTRTECVICERPTSEVGELSTRGKCEGCADGRMLANHSQLVAHRGPFFDHWRARTLAAFGVVEVDSDRDAA
jgi:hypothetical protein